MGDKGRARREAMQPIDTVPFIDGASEQQGFAFVRAQRGQLALGLTLADEGILRSF